MYRNPNPNVTTLLVVIFGTIMGFKNLILSDGVNAEIVLIVRVLLWLAVLLLIGLPFHKRFKDPSVCNEAKLPEAASLIVIVCVLRFSIPASLAAILVVNSIVSLVPVIELTLISSNVVFCPNW